MLAVCLIFSLTSCKENIETGNNIGQLDIKNTSDKKTLFFIDGEYVSKSETYISMMNSTKALTSDVYFFRSGDEFGVLYNGNYKVISKNVLCDGFSFGCIAYSASGEGVAYVDSDDNLYLYNTNEDKSTLIKSKIESDRGICISPDGKTVAYFENNTGLCLYKDGNITIFEKDDTSKKQDLVPIAVTNDGEYCFAYTSSEHESNQKNVLLLYDKSGKSKIVDKDVIPAFSTNIDNTQIMYVKFSKDKTHVLTSIYDSHEGIITSFFAASFVTPLSNLYISPGNYIPPYIVENMNTLVINTDVEDISKGYYGNKNILYYLKDDGKAELLSSECKYSASKDLKTVAYSNNYGDIYIHSSNLGERINRIAGAANIFTLTPNGQYLFFYRPDNELYCIDTKKDATEILIDDNADLGRYASGFDWVGGMPPAVLGNESIVYSDKNGNKYIWNVSGEKKKLFLNIDPQQLYTDNQNPYNKNDIILNRNLLLYRNEDKLCCLYNNGETKVVAENIK